MRVLAACLLLCFSVQALAGGVYKWTDEQGVTHYGDRPPVNQSVEIIAIEPPPPVTAVAEADADGAEAANAAAQPSAKRLNIVMYSRADCGYCKKARRYFGGRGIAYRERDIETSNQAHQQWQRLGGRGVPLFVINGKVSHGFSESGMRVRLSALGH